MYLSYYSCVLLKYHLGSKIKSKIKIIQIQPLKLDCKICLMILVFNAYFKQKKTYLDMHTNVSYPNSRLWSHLIGPHLNVVSIIACVLWQNELNYV